MPNPYVVIRVMPWWRDAVGMVSPCVPILRSLCEYYDLYAYTILICWLNKWIGSSLLEPLTIAHTFETRSGGQPRATRPQRNGFESLTCKKIFSRSKKNDSDLFQKKKSFARLKIENRVSLLPSCEDKKDFEENKLKKGLAVLPWFGGSMVTESFQLAQVWFLLATKWRKLGRS